jgi:hypothetical protein
MIKRAIDVGTILIILWGLNKFVIVPLNISGTLSSPAIITALICATIAFLTITIPFILRRK